MAATYRYFIYGLTLGSDWELPELAATPATDGSAVDLALRQVPLSEMFARQEQRSAPPDDQEIYLRWVAVGLFVMRQGREILFDPRPELPAEAVRLLLLGVCLGIALHQRGPVVLHGSAVEVDGHALAFMGAKEAGKSTMVAALLQRGHRLIADDLVVLRPEGGRHILAPGYPSIKIWPQTATMLGLDLDSMPVLYDAVDKRWLMVEDRFCAEPMPLAAMIMLKQGDGPRFETAQRGQALMRVVEQTYALRFLGKRGATASYFQASSQLVRDVPVVRLIRPLVAEKLDEVVAFVQDWAAQLP